MKKTFKIVFLTALLTVICIPSRQIHAHKEPAKAACKYLKLVTPILLRAVVPAIIATYFLKLPREERAMFSLFESNTVPEK